MSNRSMPDARVACSWHLGEAPARGELALLVELLEKVERFGSIGAAAREMAVSYRHAWGIVRSWERRFAHGLVRMQRGRGSRLTPLGSRLVLLDARLRQRLAPFLAEAQAELVCGLEEALHLQSTRLVVHASHDLGLAQLPDLLTARGYGLDLEFRGSTQSLAALREGRCDVAGFHCPIGNLGAVMWTRYGVSLNPAEHRLIRFVRRVQGIMVAAGNPKQLTAIDDLARPGLRFVNRQSGAGTRLLLDLLLQEHGIGPERIPGYAVAEYSHGAVAATIAGGAADAGLGIEAAARRFGIDFIPLVQEVYFLAVPAERLSQPALAAVISAIKSRQFQALVGALPGYDGRGGGQVLTMAQAQRLIGRRGAR